MLLHPRREEEEVVFTSPLTVKVYEEVKETRKEEVDLETGRRRSFVEEVRHEVLDLTGDTPERRGRRAPLQPLPGQNCEAAATTETTKTSRLKSASKSPLPDLNNGFCLSTPTPTRGGAPAAPGTSRTTQGVAERRSRNAVSTKYPLLR